MMFASEARRKRPKRYFSAREADTGEACLIVLTQGGLLNFESQGRMYSWVLGWRQCPLKLLQQAWWLLDVAEIRSPS